jgi:hypothetical protein
MEAATTAGLAIEPEMAEPRHAGSEPDRLQAVPACEVSDAVVLPEFDQAVRRAAHACEINEGASVRRWRRRFRCAR